MRKRDRIKAEAKLTTYSIGLGFFIGVIFMTFIIASYYTSNKVLIDNGVAEYNSNTGELEIFIIEEEEVYV